MIVAQLFPDDALLDEVAQAAAARGMFLISNGQRTVASPIVPMGWTKIVVKIKCPRTAVLEPQSCAA